MKATCGRSRSIVLPLVFAAAITAAIAAEVNLAPPDAAAKLPAGQRITLERIRTIAIAVESFAVDNNRYPGPTDGAEDLSFLKRDLVPTYLESTEWDDGWDRRMRFLSDGESYVIISFGSDGVPDVEDWDAGEFDAERLDAKLCGGPVGGTKRDVVFMDGVFCQYPEDL